MSGFEPIIKEALINLIKNPTLLSIFIATLIGLFYYFGSIINANNWQYNNLQKQLHIYHGFQFMVQFVFFPIIIIYVIDSFFDIVSFLQKVPLIAYFILIIILYLILLKLDSWIYGKLRDFDNPIYPNLGVGVARAADLKYILYLSNYGILILTKDSVLILAMILFDFLIISELARLSNLNQQGAKADIKLLDSNEVKTVRLIEFVEKGTFLKVQEKETKDALAIPTSRIEFLKLIDETPNTSLIKELFNKKINIKNEEKVSPPELNDTNPKNTR